MYLALPYKQKVRGSSPRAPTTYFKYLAFCFVPLEFLTLGETLGSLSGSPAIRRAGFAFIGASFPD